MLERLFTLCLLKRLQSGKRKTKIVCCSLPGCVSGVPERLLSPKLVVQCERNQLSIRLALRSDGNRGTSTLCTKEPSPAYHQPRQNSENSIQLFPTRCSLRKPFPTSDTVPRRYVRSCQHAAVRKQPMSNRHHPFQPRQVKHCPLDAIKTITRWK